MTFREQAEKEWRDAVARGDVTEKELTLSPCAESETPLLPFRWQNHPGVVGDVVADQQAYTKVQAASSAANAV